MFLHLALLRSMKYNASMWNKQEKTTNLETLSGYMEEVLGVKPKFVPRENAPSLPFFLSQLYEFHTAELYGKAIFIARLRTDERLTPLEFSRHAAVLRESFSDQPVFVLPAVTSWDRKRLISYRVSFIVPGTQLFLPLLGIDLRERYPAPRVEVGKLLPAAQFLILYHLQKESLDGFSIRELSRKFDYSPSAISRAVSQVISLGLASAKPGKEKRLSFRYEGSELWTQAQPYLSSPVVRTIPVATADIPLSCTASGLSALSVLTALDQGPIKYCSTSAAEYRNLPVKPAFEDERNPDADRLEIWSYNPKLLTTNGVADPLSLYLEFTGETDERINIALEDLLRECFKW